MTPYPNRDAFEDMCEALANAPHPKTLIGGEAFDPVTYMDWWFKDRAAALARARNEKETG